MISAQRVVVDLRLLRLEAVRLQLPPHEVAPRDLELLAFRVAAEVDDLHPVAERPRDGVQHVGGGDEHHARQVEGHAEVVVAEGAVLLRVQHLQHRRRGVALDAAPHLVDLVQHHHAVPRAGLADALDDVARQRADIGAPMAADLRLVVDAAERDAREGPPHGAGDGLARARSCPRRAARRSRGSAPCPPARACAPRGTRRCAA